MSSNKFTDLLKQATPARIGISHVGLRYPTRASLKFWEDWALAKDSLHEETPVELLKELGLLVVGSQAEDRGSYLMNTRSGRFLSKESEAIINNQAIPGADVQIVCSDGLSSLAFRHNVPQMLPLIDGKLKNQGVKVGYSIFIHRARVAILDHVGELLHPKVGLILIGERPGLGISDSLSGYFEYDPRFGRVESDRNVLSNIHGKGIPPTEAALMLADACLKCLQLEKSGMGIRFNFT